MLELTLPDRTGPAPRAAIGALPLLLLALAAGGCEDDGGLPVTAENLAGRWVAVDDNVRVFDLRGEDDFHPYMAGVDRALHVWMYNFGARPRLVQRGSWEVIEGDLHTTAVWDGLGGAGATYRNEVFELTSETMVISSALSETGERAYRRESLCPEPRFDGPWRRVNLGDADALTDLLSVGDPDIAVADDGTVHILTSDSKAGAGVAHISNPTGCGFTYRMVAPSGSSPSIAVAASGEAHWAFEGPNDPSIIGREINPGGAAPSIAVDSAGVAHVAYVAEAGVRHATGGTDESVADRGDAHATDIVATSDGLYVAFAASDGAHLATRQGGAWGVVKLPGRACDRVAMTVDRAGAAWVVCEDNGRIVVHRQSGGQWVTDDVGSGAGPGVAALGEEQAWLAWVGDSGAFVLAERDGGGWASTVLDQNPTQTHAPGQPHGAAVTLDAAGDVHVVYSLSDGSQAITYFTTSAAPGDGHPLRGLP